MTKALKEVLAEVERLPEADQENISRHVLNHVEKLRALRAGIDTGMRSLDGQGRKLDMEEVIAVARSRRYRKGSSALLLEEFVPPVFASRHLSHFTLIQSLLRPERTVGRDV